jgi:hypothetical protein
MRSMLALPWRSSRVTSRRGCETAVRFCEAIMPKYDLIDVADFIDEFSTAMEGISEDWQDDLDAAVRKLFPNISDALLAEARTLNDVTEFIYEFAKAKAGISKDWQDDLDPAVRRLFPSISDDLLQEAKELADDQIIGDIIGRRN